MGAWNASTYLYFHKIKNRTSIYCRKRVTVARDDMVSWNNTLDIKIGELIYRSVGLKFCILDVVYDVFFFIENMSSCKHK